MWYFALSRRGWWCCCFTQGALTCVEQHCPCVVGGMKCYKDWETLSWTGFKLHTQIFISGLSKIKKQRNRSEKVTIYQIFKHLTEFHRQDPSSFFVWFVCFMAFITLIDSEEKDQKGETQTAMGKEKKQFWSKNITYIRKWFSPFVLCCDLSVVQLVVKSKVRLFSWVPSKFRSLRQHYKFFNYH